MQGRPSGVVANSPSRAHQPDARLERIRLGVAAGADGASGVEPDEAPKRGALQPARVDAGRDAARVLGAQRAGVRLAGGVIDRVAMHEVALDAQPRQRVDEIARRREAELPGAARAPQSVAVDQPGEIDE